MKNSIIIAVVIGLFGNAFAGSYGAPALKNHYHGHHDHSHAHHDHGHAHHVGLKTSAPHGYKHSIPAAAIRNVETVGITKTITPVVTKTTTRLTHSEPALSIGHVQGYTQSAIGSPKIAPVQFNTQYTTYSNPTVGVNGPVTYSGPAVATGYAAIPVGYAAAGVAGHGGGYGYGVAAAPSYAAAGPYYAAAVPSYAAAVPSYAAAVPSYAAAVPVGAGYASQHIDVAEYAPALSLETYGSEAYEAPVAAYTEVQAGQPVYASGDHSHYGHSAYAIKK